MGVQKGGECAHAPDVILFQDLHQYKDAQLAIAMARGLDGYNADVECAHGVLHEAQGESAEGEWLWLVR